jgi:hypothetical protein
LTPNPWDMYKFFIFAWVPIAVLTGWIFADTKKSAILTPTSESVLFSRKVIANKLLRTIVIKTKKSARLKIILFSISKFFYTLIRHVFSRKIMVLTLVLFSIITSASVITFNLGTNFLGASNSEYQLGLWVRDDTPQQSVFLTYSGTIHSPPGFIGGRLIVSSYVNWPYGWGVPLGDIMQRASNVDRAYNGNAIDLAQVVTLYNVSYVYVGNEELSHYPGCTARLDNISWLTMVYSIQDGSNNLRIYQVNSTAINP